MNRKKEQGALTVEAALFLSMFIVFFVSLMNLTDVVRTQVLIQNAVTQTAKELSQYSYILTKTGVVSASNKTAGEAKEVKEDVESVANDAIQIANAIHDGAVTGDIENSMQTIEDSSEHMSDTLDVYIEDPENLLSAAMVVAKDGVQSAAKARIVGAITKSRLKTHLSVSGADPDKKLRQLGVVNGLNGIDFSESRWFDSGTQDIVIVAKYKMKIKYMFVEAELPQFKVCGATKIW